MKAFLVLSVALLLQSTPAHTGIIGPGKYNGVVIFDRWDACHLYTGVYQMEISEKIKESLRPYREKAILIDAEEVYQPMNPGDALIEKLTILGQTENTTPSLASPPALEGLSLRSTPSFSEQGPDELIVELRNDSNTRRQIDIGALGPTLLTKRLGFECFTPADGPSYPILTRWSVSFMQQSIMRNSCMADGKGIVARASLAPGFAMAQKFDLDPGQSIEAPIRFDLSAGEYEFLAGYGSSYQAPALASNLVDFDVDDSGKPHLIERSRALNQVRAPRRAAPVCGRILLENGSAASQATVYLWSLPFPKTQPRVANMATVGADGTFRMEEVVQGNYVLSATRREENGVSLGAYGGTRPSEAAPLSLPDSSGTCSLFLIIHPQPTYAVRGRTKAGPGRTARIVMKSGAAFPFESTAVVQADGRYEFRNVPAGSYQFFAGWTGSAFEVEGDIDDAKIEIRWPDRPSTASDGETMPPSFNEVMAVVEMKNLQQAELTYAKTYNNGFTRSLDALGPPPEWYHETADRAALLDKIGTVFFAPADDTHFTSNGYRFTYCSNVPDRTGKITGYAASARPTQWGRTGTRSFFMDESGVIHATDNDEPATKEDHVVSNGR